MNNEPTSTTPSVLDRFEAIKMRWTGPEPTLVLAEEARRLLAECAPDSDDALKIRKWIAWCAQCCPF